MHSAWAGPGAENKVVSVAGKDGHLCMGGASKKLFDRTSRVTRKLQLVLQQLDAEDGCGSDTQRVDIFVLQVGAVQRETHRFGGDTNGRGAMSEM